MDVPFLFVNLLLLAGAPVIASSGGLFAAGNHQVRAGEGKLPSVAHDDEKISGANLFVGRGPATPQMGKGSAKGEMGKGPAKCEMGKGPEPCPEMGKGPEPCPEMGKGPEPCPAKGEMGKGPEPCPAKGEMGKGPARVRWEKALKSLWHPTIPPLDQGKVPFVRGFGHSHATNSSVQL